VSHLGDTLSALVDGELGGAELDRANAHVAECGACRVEASALRRLKQELRHMAEAGTVVGNDDFVNRLLAMSSQAGQDAKVPVRHLRQARGSGAALARRRLIRGGRVRYLLWSAVSLVVLGLGSLAFGLGGSGAGGPQITPQLEVFDAQHALFSGDMPFTDPATDGSARVPALTGAP
jgi:anti-sigma factor RsiW